MTHVVRGVDRPGALMHKREVVDAVTVTVLETDNNERLHSPRQIHPASLRYLDGCWTTSTSKSANGDDDDCHERLRLRFRGINLPAKTPSYPPNLKTTRNADRFFESKSTVSFVDRPFPLSEAPTHLQRLSNFGFNLIRLGVTWEAVMHEGPGKIDEAYLEYLTKLVDIAQDFGLYVLIDPHQDVWSRFSGGDGAPAWTLDAIGFKTDEESFHNTGCAVLHQYLKSDECPRMLWPTNYWKLVTATMFTLFFAGDVYASGQTVENTNETFQQFLQRNYLRYLDAVAECLKSKKNVIGFGTMNEPNPGFVGVPDLNESHAPAPYGNVLSGFESIRLGSGEMISSDYYPYPFIYGHTDKLNKMKKSVWKSTDHDVWKNAGIYDIDECGTRVLLRPHHFSLKGNNENEDFISKFMKPFFHSVHETITRHNKHFVTFAEPQFADSDPFVHAPDDLDPKQFAWAPHFYDFLMLVLKVFIPWLAINVDSELPVFTPYLIDRAFRKNLKRSKESGRGMHVLLGECGIPFDMGSHTNYVAALNRVLKAMEANDLDYALWCYYPENTDYDGDEWNGENLSITTKDGNRGLLSAVRPYAYKYSCSVEIVSQQYDPFTRSYKLVVQLDGSPKKNGAGTDILVFVPNCHFDHPSTSISVSSGSTRRDLLTQTLVWQLNSPDVEVEANVNNVLQKTSIATLQIVTE